MIPAGAVAALALLLATGLAVVVAVVAVRLARPDEPERVAVWLFDAAVLLATPGYPWYCLPLVAPAVVPDKISPPEDYRPGDRLLPK